MVNYMCPLKSTGKAILTLTADVDVKVYIRGCPHITSAVGGGKPNAKSVKDVCKRDKLSQLCHNICFFVLNNQMPL